MARHLDSKFQFSYLYRITNKFTGEYYIGIRSCNGNPEDDSYMGSGIRITASIEKYGRDNFQKEILKVCESREDASQAEAEMVNEDRLKDPLCLNLKTGGEYVDGTVYSPEVGEKISDSIKKTYAENPEYGRKLSESLKKTYAENPEYGKKISEMRKRVAQDPVHRQKVSEARKKLFRETDLRERLMQSFSTTEFKEKKSKSMKDYCATENGKCKISNATKNTTYVNKDGKTKRVKNSNLESYLSDGWNLGSALETGADTRQKLSESGKGRVWIFNSQLMKNLKIKKESLHEYLDQGWEKGTRKWKQNSTPEINLENSV